MRDLVQMSLLLTLYLLFYLLTAMGVALSHDWYPRACCSDRDCAPIACSLLEVQPDGTIRDTVKGAYYPRALHHPSPDAQCHVCHSKYIPLCVFIPIQGS